MVQTERPATPPTAPDGLAGRHVVFYDGVCGFCDRLVRFVLPRDRDERFRFATLQGDFASATLMPLGADPAQLDTFYVLADYGTPRARLLDRSTAALFLAGQLGWPWRAAAALRILPKPLRDLGYRGVARVRYRFFGRYDHCPVPSPEQRARFVDS